MDILTYPVGVVLGLAPVVVSLTPDEVPAELLLNGRQVCVFTSPSQPCTVDFGPVPHLAKL